ncbi:HAD-like protein [Aureobasidium namibiae CBS 147.97]|uniref:HAD-like protein n=1 Tax=Aureobasidium namibiae CBS 147.97 TaxID=1043004 RepID=A0A074WUB9_9PEZI
MAPVRFIFEQLFSFEQLIGYLILWISIISWLRWLTLEQKIKEILFDCDNTLVLSEHLAFEACAELANEILEKHGKSARYTGPQLLKEFVGQNFRGMMVSLQKKYGFEIPEDEFNAYVDRELGKVVETLEKKAEPCAGATEVLEKLYKSKKYGLAVVSSSALSRVQASIRKVGQDKFFPAEHVYSAATSLEKPTSKPDPAIYLHACKEIGVEPSQCVAIEDSKSGATAAKNAKIPLIGYVGAYDDKEEIDRMAKMLTEECGAIVIMYHWNEFFDCMEKVEQSLA